MQDQADMTRLLDALPNVDMINPFFGPQDVPPEIMTPRPPPSCCATPANRCSPPPRTRRGALRHRNGGRLCGGIETLRKGPNLSITVSPVSPLIFTEKVTSAIMAIAEAGIPSIRCRRRRWGPPAPSRWRARLHSNTPKCWLVSSLPLPPDLGCP